MRSSRKISKKNTKRTMKRKNYKRKSLKGGKIFWGNTSSENTSATNSDTTDKKKSSWDVFGMFKSKNAASNSEPNQAPTVTDITTTTEQSNSVPKDETISNEPENVQINSLDDDMNNNVPSTEQSTMEPNLSSLDETNYNANKTGGKRMKKNSKSKSKKSKSKSKSKSKK
jgi:hypothetical protein